MQSGVTIGIRPKYLSYVFIVVVFVAIAWLNLATPLLAALFSYLALKRLQFAGRPWAKWLALLLFSFALVAIALGVGHVLNQSVKALPQVADKAIPAVLRWADEQGIALPFSDYESLKAVAFETLKSQDGLLPRLAGFARGTTTQVVFLIIGGVVAASLFLNSQFELGRDPRAVRNNLYSLLGEEIRTRFGTLYLSFEKVMGAQILISTINTGLTAAFTLAVDLPHPAVIIGVTFCCGLLPVIGNLISNTVIVAIGFTVSPALALASLVFLIVIHKLEYFLNSKIIGGRIRNPVWLILLGLIVGEALMGLPGMILAPVVLHYVKVEMAAIEVVGAAVGVGDRAGDNTDCRP